MKIINSDYLQNKVFNIFIQTTVDSLLYDKGNMELTI